MNGKSIQKGGNGMLDTYLEPRHWTPREGYATGDALVGLLNQGWQIKASKRAPGQTRAPMFIVSLERDDDVLTVLALDGPVVRKLVPASVAMRASTLTAGLPTT
jgi:hypothetical protein